MKNTVKVSYDSQTKIVTGYYPSWISYPSIPTPNITISKEFWESFTNKEMMVDVINKTILEYKRSEQSNIVKEKLKLISSRKNYLESTDWYSAREQDEPNSYPAGIKTKRILARKEIGEIKEANSLVELNNFNKNFK